MMENSESCVPPGFRFHPTDEELVGYYLKKKVACQKIDLDVIRDIDLYRIEPWDLQERCRIGYEEQSEWYFFSHKDKKYPTGTRTNRATMAGFWKATGRDKAVYDKNKLIGMRKTLVFYKGRAPNGQKSDWIMHEYRLESEENAPPQEEGWVVCRAFKKRTNSTSTTQSRMTEAWDHSTFCYDEPNTGVSSVLDSIDYLPQNPQSSSFICKQEIESIDNLNNDNYLQYPANPFVQLPELLSPSLPLIKRPTLASSVAYENEEDGYNNYIEKVTDWRTLDKFVASQLSQGDQRFDHRSGEMSSTDEVGMVHAQDHSDMAALLLLQSSREEGNKLNGLLSSATDCDFGICIFEK